MWLTPWDVTHLAFGFLELEEGAAAHGSADVGKAPLGLRVVICQALDHVPQQTRARRAFQGAFGPRLGLGAGRPGPLLLVVMGRFLG